MTNPTHSPLPWRLGSDAPDAIFDAKNKCVAICDMDGIAKIEKAKADAALIVRAVNRDADFSRIRSLIEYISPALFVLRNIFKAHKIQAGEAKAVEMIASVQEALSGLSVTDADLTSGKQALRDAAFEELLAAAKTIITRSPDDWITLNVENAERFTAAIARAEALSK